MLRKCANPACLAPFRKLSDGKLFLVEMEPFEGSRMRRGHWRGPSFNRIEYYWLCDPCAFGFTLSYEKGRGVVTVARPDTAKATATVTVRPEKTSHNANSRTEQSA